MTSHQQETQETLDLPTNEEKTFVSPSKNPPLKIGRTLVVPVCESTTSTQSLAALRCLQICTSFYSELSDILWKHQHPVHVKLHETELHLSGQTWKNLTVSNKDYQRTWPDDICIAIFQRDTYEFI